MPDLTGKRVVVTRAEHQAEELARPLRKLGAEVLLCPVIGIAPAIDQAALIQAAQNVNGYDWLVFTSANAVESFAASLPERASRTGARVAAIGPATAERARSLGFEVTIAAENSVSEGLSAVLAAFDLDGKRVLIPSAAMTRDLLPGELKRHGAEVTVVEAYRNIVPPGARQRCEAVFLDPLPDWVTFASASAVHNLIQFVVPSILSGCALGSIGPVTSAALRKYDLMPAVEADPHTIPGIVSAIASSNHNL